MIFLWPDMLWLLFAAPILIAAYILVLRRKNKRALRYASLNLLKQAGVGKGFRRHVPPLLFLAAMIALILAIARPAAMITLPSERGIVILAMDVSGSMRADDIAPTRMIAAKNAAKSFIAGQPGGTRIGLVAFSSTAMMVQSPTSDRDDAIKAIDRMQPIMFTAVGSGILVSLKAIFPDTDIDLMPDSFNPRRGAALGEAPPKTEQPSSFQPVAPGSYKSAVIVLLSDGQTNVGPNPVEAARMAAERGVRIFTVGFGTPEGTTIHFGDHSMLVQLDEETLKKVADMTHGTYARAGTETDLKRIYQSITTELVMEKQRTEIAGLFSAAGSILAILSALFSVLWFGRIF